MDPNVATREEFTKHLTSLPYPKPSEGSAPEWYELVTKLAVLLDKLAHHEAMAPNLQQTYMTPAASKNKIYFMWDFVGRTLGIANRVDCDLKDLSSYEKEQWEDAKGRSIFAGQLMLNDKMLHPMVESTYPGRKGKHPAFGDELLKLAREL